MALHNHERIRTLELSDAEFGCDTVRFMTMYSPALEGRADVSVFVPRESEAGTPPPVVFLLHGVYGSHWAWFFKGAAHRTAAELISAGRIRPMLLVSPSDGLQGDGSGYLPHPGFDAEAWITRDLMEGLRKAFPEVREDSSVFIAGLSMGGYGALRLGAKYPELFRGISAHSAITEIDEMEMFTYETFSPKGIAAQELDIMGWMERHRKMLPPLRFDCGLQDQLLDGNRRLHAALQQRGIAHTYCEADGGHDWLYWQTQFAASLLFFEGVLAGYGNQSSDAAACKPGTTTRQS
jgi:putative tributyrin esterase